MKILYYLFLIITSIIAWFIIMIGVGFLVGKDAAAFLSPASVALLLLPVWLYKTKKTLKGLSNMLLLCVLGWVVLAPITYFSLINAAYNSAPGKEGLGAAIGLPILAGIFVVYIGGGALVTLLLAGIARFLARYEKKN